VSFQLTDRLTHRLTQGSVPLLLSLPHVGTDIPAELAQAYVPRALQTEDTDWHLEQLYGFAHDLGASVLVPQISRYVIDLNRPPDDAPMYPGAANTELCPTRFFTGEALYRSGQEPTVDERLRRRNAYWQPYHSALATELARLQKAHGYALLWDGHSIRSELPWLFAGKLPDLNIGTADGTSANATLTVALKSIDTLSTSYITAINGRFKGGYITRHYGKPGEHIHAVQLEMCQHLYMQEAAPFSYDVARAAQVQPMLRTLLQTALSWGRQQYAG
jgi:N-formylglutamate deformylase